MKKIIRNSSLYWPRLAQLVNAIAHAKKHHKAHSHLEREARMIRNAIMECELRQDKRSAA